MTAHAATLQVDSDYSPLLPPTPISIEDVASLVTQRPPIPPLSEPDGSWIGGEPSTGFLAKAFFGLLYAGCIALAIATLTGKLG